jgi:predicted nucleic acid-binding protein
VSIALPQALVVDCSIIAGMFLPDEESPLAARIRDASADLALFAPRLLRVEFANVALMARRRGRLDERRFVALLSQGAQFPIQYDSEEPSLVEYAESAYTLGLTSYDYAYLDCARRRRLPLATLDRDLIGAAARAGVRVLGEDFGVGEATTPWAAERPVRVVREPRASRRRLAPD